MVDGVGRTRRQLFGIGFQRFHDLGDAALWLRVATGDHGPGFVFHVDVRIDAVASDYVFPVSGAASGKRGSLVCACSAQTRKRVAIRDSGMRLVFWKIMTSLAACDERMRRVELRNDKNFDARHSTTDSQRL